MTDEEEKRTRQELLAVELKLRRKQEFWETPRNIAILIGVTAAIAATIGFWLGRASAPHSPTTTPVFGIGNFNDPTTMTSVEFVDAVQTAGIVVIALMVIYVVVRLDRTITVAAKRLKTMIVKQQGLEEGIERVWARIDLIESLQQGAQRPELRPMLDEIHRRLDALEGQK